MRRTRLQRNDKYRACGRKQKCRVFEKNVCLLDRVGSKAKQNRAVRQIETFCFVGEQDVIVKFSI